MTMSNVISKTPLTNQEIFKVAPSVFAEAPHESRSSKYTYIPTIQIVEALRKEGFLPFGVQQSGSRIEGKKEFTKHMIRFRNHNDAVVGKDVNEIILINSHDGTSAYKMMAGCFRFVCSNGMVVGDTFEDMKVLHKGNVVDDIIECAYEIIDRFEIVEQEKEIFKSLQLSNEEQEIFAKAALELKYEPDESPIKSSKLLLPKRFEDRTNDLWTKFNTVQENLVRGGQTGINRNGNRVTTRAVKSIDNNVKLNRALWTLTSEMAKLKK